MIEPEFNLLDEPWIIASDRKGKDVILSLKDTLLSAHDLLSLSGELPTQDVAVMRLLLGVLHSIFSRMDENGEPFNKEEERCPEDVYALWKRLWDLKQFPEKVVVNYFEKYHDRFYLFHNEFPFYQVAGLNEGTSYKAAKLIGDISESNNKKRLFLTRSGKEKKAIPFAEAARWLLYVNAFDDTSAKQANKVRDGKLPAVGAGWLGKLGLVYADGNSLFETLLLNLTLLDDEERLWKEGFAAWELDEPRKAERAIIRRPHNQAALLTLQSRHVLLEKTGNSVTGYILIGGDFFEKENAYSEQMTLWHKSPDKPNTFTPKRHDSSRQLWRDFPVLLLENKVSRVPGIVKWLRNLEYEGLISTEHIKLRVTSAQYADKDFFVNDLLDDSISVNAKLLEYLGKEDEWIVRINDALALTDSFVYAVGTLAVDLAEASGESYNNSEGSKRRKMAYRDKTKETAYFNLDVPFRNWLSSVDPETDDETKKIEEWLKKAERIIRNLAERMFADTGVVAFSGKKGINGMTSPMAMKKFNLTIIKIKKGGTVKWENQPSKSQ